MDYNDMAVLVGVSMWIVTGGAGTFLSGMWVANSVKLRDVVGVILAFTCLSVSLAVLLLGVLGWLNQLEKVG